MRKVCLLCAFVVGSVLVGCGKNESLDPQTMNPEQEKKFQEDEMKAASQEQQHQAERRNNGPLTPQQQAEMQERQHQARR